MVHKRFTNDFGPEYGEDDGTDFLYDKKEYGLLKKIVDEIDITICRDGDAAEGGNLDVLIRRGNPQSGIETTVEMIPVHGAISHVETPWSKSSEINYKTFSYIGGFKIGLMEGNEIKSILNVWYSQEEYLKADPKFQFNKEDTIREHTPQEPIESTIPIKKD